MRPTSRSVGQSVAYRRTTIRSGRHARWIARLTMLAVAGCQVSIFTTADRAPGAVPVVVAGLANFAAVAVGAFPGQRIVSRAAQGRCPLIDDVHLVAVTALLAAALAVYSDQWLPMVAMTAGLGLIPVLVSRTRTAAWCQLPGASS